MSDPIDGDSPPRGETPTGTPETDPLAETSWDNAGTDGDVTPGPSPKPAPASLRPGSVVADRFEVIRLLGKGGMGAVYQCLDRQLQRKVALKRLLPELCSEERSIQRFLFEARAVAALNHPNVVQIHDVIDNPAEKFIVMEFVDGESLQEHMKRKGKLSVLDAARIMTVIGKALEVAHRAKIIHRDVKPGNILLNAQGVPKLSDFGISQITDAQDLTRTGTGMGSLVYASPEQLEDAKHVDHRADVYALGATMYEMLTGEIPRHIRLEKIPAAIRPVLDKCLNRSPKERYQTAEQFVRALVAAYRDYESECEEQGAVDEPATAESTVRTRSTAALTDSEVKTRRELWSAGRAPYARSTRMAVVLVLVPCLLGIVPQLESYAIKQLPDGTAVEPIERVLDYVRLGAVFAWLLVIVAGTVMRLATKYSMTPLRLKIVTGLFVREQHDFALSDFDGVSASQKGLGKVLGYGDIELSRRYDEPVFLYDIRRPHDVRRKMISALKG